MSDPEAIVEQGLLVRSGGCFTLRSDSGRTFTLDLARTPVDHVEKRVRITGTLIGDALVEVDSIAPAG